jgi:hypothetical protein
MNDEPVDEILSSCVIEPSPDPPAVLAEEVCCPPGCCP